MLMQGGGLAADEKAVGKRGYPVRKALFFLIFGTGGISAQTQNAQINGIIYDQVGAAVPDAAVTAVNTGTRIARTVQSTTTGNYVISNLVPGRYRVEVTQSGFQKSVSQEFNLDVNQITTLDFHLTLGAVSQSVEVSAEATQLEASNAQLGTVVTQEKIVDLPLNARNFTQLLTLSPGATPVSVAQNSGGAQVQRVGTFVFPAVNGQSNRSNTFTLDGVYNDAPWMNTYAVAPNVDGLAQFKVQSHSDQAEFGGVTGGVVNIATKSGTNQFHGSLYEFLRNDALDARAFFAAKKPTLRQNQFGGTVGGPVIKDKTFFFFTYEGYRQVNASSRLYLVPTPAELGGDFSAMKRAIHNPFSARPDPAKAGSYLRDPFANNTIPASLINKSTSEWAKTIIPAPIDTGNPSFNGRNTTSQTAPMNQYSIRVDHNFTPSDFLWSRFTWGTQNQESAGTLQGTLNRIETPARNFGASYTHVFGANTLLNGLFGYSSLTQNNVPFLTARNMFAEGLFAGFPRKDGLNAPGIGMPSAFGTQGSRVDFLGPQAAYQMRGDLSHVHGNHTLKFGGQILWVPFFDDTYDGNLTFNASQTADLNNPGNTGSDIASFVLGAIDAWEYRDRKYDYQTQLWNFYAEDSWKATDKLTVNLGLRWDLLRNSSFRLNFPSTWDFGSGQFIVGAAAPPACSGSQPAPCLPDPQSAYVKQHVVFTGQPKLREDDYKMFGPRVGLAYRLRPTLVVRSSFGVFYDLQAGVTQQAQNASGAWPNTNLLRGVNINRPIVSVLANDPFGGADPRIPAASPATAQAFFFDPHFQNPYSLQWNLDIQKQLANNVTLSTAYVGSNSLRLPIGGFYNTALTPGPGAVQPRALWTYAPASNYDRSIGRGNYNALQVKLEQRFSKGLSYLVGYTWSKSIDIASSGQFGVEGFSLQNPYVPNNDRSVSAYDIPQNFSAAVVYDLPFGKGRRWAADGAAARILGNWQFNAIVLIRSGQPYTPTMGLDVANIGTNSTRPNLVGNAVMANPVPEAWFNKSAYASPAVYNFGTAGRDQLRTDGYQNFDLSLFRQDNLTERVKLQLRVELFNAFNQPTFGTPQTNFTNSRFGQVSSTVSTARQIQLGMKVLF